MFGQTFTTEIMVISLLVLGINLLALLTGWLTLLHILKEFSQTSYSMND